MSLIEVEVQPEYRSLVGNIVKDFYNPLLSRAVMYKRSVGFFSSSALSEISKGIFGLVRNGGHIQLVASPYLSESDIHSIKMGYEDRDRIIKEAILKELKEPETVFEGQRLNILANLISSGVMDIKIALIEDKNNLGMYHEKMGIIVDSDGNRVAFSGSMNESSTALLVNYETIDAFCSWNGANEEKRVIIKEQAFESIWNNVDPNVTIIDFPELTDEIINRYKKSDVDFEKEDNDRGYDFPDFNIEVELDTNHYPRVPDGFSFHDYQLEAIDNWEKNDYVGIFDMATGTGKTYTGLGSVVRLSEKLNHKLAVIIVCPFQHLVEQWAEDIRKFNMEPIIGYSSSSQKDWKKSLENAVFDQKLNLEGKEFFCLVCTNATFSSSFVQTQLNRINGDCLLLVDEAHNFGSLNLRKLLDEKYNYRLALSATLERIYDEDGTKKLMEYFGNKCIEYDLRRAIEEKKLTRYKYYPVLVELTSDELKKVQCINKADRTFRFICR
ncbi:DEAD/DEAH box helicase family protein [Ruminococcus sp. HUN007]|uniref:DEAD/DEAH box helicase family protein n=1 Tax=Ruminococcus sp. HUN007 TaxID=1514668 RepID=UPI001FA705EC|nr:DEAD/DEAH box helicase family protein [Ruminococcus sp. HUN007]